MKERRQRIRSTTIRGVAMLRERAKQQTREERLLQLVNSNILLFSEDL
jgi:hypothetical protein